MSDLSFAGSIPRKIHARFIYKDGEKQLCEIPEAQETTFDLSVRQAYIVRVLNK